MMQLPKTIPLLLLAASITLGLCGCGQSEAKKVATQVVAKVGAEEISVHQINQVLNATNTNGATPEAVKGMSREVLEKLIDQQLAIEQSTEKKLDRSPEVMAQLEAARREILSRAYLQQLVAGLPKPSTEEVKAYYSSHPQLFTERRVFSVQELIAPAQPEVKDQIESMTKAGKSMEEIAAWLKAHDIKFNATSATRSAEQIPMDLLNRLQPLKDGQSLMAQTPQAITLVHIVQSRTMPIDEATALPRIEQFLGNQHANEAVASNMKALRNKTKIEYMGEFAQSAEKAAPVAAAPASAATGKPEDQAKATLEKGIAGLK
jgi:EpsD family peptidyl-prolyl cis-trans isomerase